MKRHAVRESSRLHVGVLLRASSGVMRAVQCVQISELSLAFSFNCNAAAGCAAGSVDAL